MSVRRTAHWASLVWLVIATAATLSAQPLPVAPRAPRHAVAEVRVDGFAGRAPGAQAGVGVVLDAGTYTRLALVAGAGVERRSHADALTGVQRVEGVARFHVDPFRQGGRGLYAGGGIAARHAAGSPLRALLVALVGIESRPHGGVASAVEAGVGGGVRVGVALRGARRDRR